ncbi:MAG: LEA type 2 family protein [Candidatus Deferrimicrobiota bacterium]|jgi:LEA14-like dessication related protein
MRIAKRSLLLLALLAFSFAANSCRGLMKEVFKPPKVRVVDVALASNPLVDPKGPWGFRLTLSVDNPNTYPLNVTYVAYTAIIGRETVAEGEQRSDLRIEASGVTEVKVPLTVRPEAFSKVGRQMLQARRLDYEFNGSVGLDAPVVGVIRIPFSKTGAIDPVDLLIKKGFGFN